MQVSKRLVQYILISGNVTWDTPMAVTITIHMATTPKAIHILGFRAPMEPSGDKVRGVNPNGSG